VDFVGRPDLFQHDADLEAVRRRPEMKVDWLFLVHCFRPFAPGPASASVMPAHNANAA
jgi:hypothetical protein